MKKCFVCGKEVSEEDVYCINCGTKLIVEQEKKKEEVKEVPLKKRSTAFLLAIFFGLIGAHNYYLGHKTKFLVQFCLSVVTVGLLSPIVFIWGIVEGFIIIFNKNYKDGLGRKLL